jgi:hypothetical protein
MGDRELTLLLMVVSLKKELLDLAITVKNENERTFSRTDIVKDLMEMLSSCSEIEELCTQV